MIVAHLTASTFFGGPERQILGLSKQLLPSIGSVLLSFAEGGRCQAFLDEAGKEGFLGHALTYDTPWLRASARELTHTLDSLGVDVLCCHGYKADLIGRVAARRLSIPAVAVSRGWTAESIKVRLYESLDRLNLRWMDRVICVSEGQAVKVRRAGVDPARVSVIRNAIDANRFADPDLRYLRWLHECFPKPRRMIIGSAGRLSPEKGFEVLVEAAAKVHARDTTLGFIHFGDGPERESMSRAIERSGLSDVFVLGGLRHDLDNFYPFFDLLALPSYTEGLPNVVLEAFAARVPVVATAVGGTPEVVDDGVSGHLVPPGNADMLAECILDVLSDDDRRLAMGQRGYRRVCQEFTFDAQARAYTRLFADLLGESGAEPVRERVEARKESVVR